MSTKKKTKPTETKAETVQEPVKVETKKAEVKSPCDGCAGLTKNSTRFCLPCVNYKE